jgi:eukaryotic-like serine/threonine-protein kinase
MDAERWRLIEELFDAARSLPPGVRAEFLAQRCGRDASLLSEVESLLGQPDVTWSPGVAPTPAGAMAPASLRLVGHQIGSYRIGPLIGAGGMGEIYRARDARLGRDVAVKILPREWMADPDRLARLEREARVLASLNHPNIATIHGIEEADGIRALVLELVEGDTLAERIAAAPLALPDALRLATQITDALDAAHEKGIIHRDLKPANIKITPAGVVKVLDFGLAKLGGAADARVSQSPTLTVAGTREGVIAGTAAYMSPEQARGLVVDKRTDIWAFGCVFFEMLSGHVAFGRETVSDTLAAVLEREPDWSRLPRTTPVTIQVLLSRCLEKDPRRRIRDIGDVRIELDGSRQPAPHPDVNHVAAHSLRSWRSWVVVGALMATSAGVAVGARATPS